MKLKNKITIMTVTIIIFIISLLSCFAAKQITCEIRQRIESNLIKLAITIANNPIIEDNIGLEEGFEIINTYANDIRYKAEVDFIVVTDMMGIRYSHTENEKVGKAFSNNGIVRAIKYGETYIDEGEGTNGFTVKAFTPVIRDGTQVGVVCVGYKKIYFSDAYNRFAINLLPFVGVVLLIGIIIARLLARNIKKDIYGLEPEEIAILLKEREVILDGITDGLIAINKEGKITLINRKAEELLNLEYNCQNEDISVLHSKIYMKFKDLLTNRESIINIEQKLNDNISIVSNYTLLESNGVILGAIMTFKTIADVSVLIEMLAGVKKLNWDLRAQNHEFMNKLQTISGLIQLERYDEAIDYIHVTTIKRNEVMKTLDNIKVVSIAALLLAKIDKAGESKVSMVIDAKSNLRNMPRGIDEIELGCIVGNLLENSIEELKGKKDGKISVFINQDEKLQIVISNNGNEITQNEIKKIFERGYSKKGKQRGLGLYNINEIVNGVNGTITVKSDKDKTTWKVEI